MQRHASRRIGPPANGGAARFALAPGRDEQLAARLRLLEGFVARTDIADCAHYALEWLAGVLGLPQSICLLKRAGSPVLASVAVHGFSGSSAASFSVPTEEWSSPLVLALSTRKHVFFPTAHTTAERRRRPSTPFEDGPFHVLPLGGTSGFGEDAIGVLLVGGGPGQLRPGLHWFATLLGQKLDQILRQQALTDVDRKQGRERSLLYSIINAVTDPILLTDTEGRLLIANARALTLFTATEEESEGRRSAVRMNNMLLSSALSSKAIEVVVTWNVGTVNAGVTGQTVSFTVQVNATSGSVTNSNYTIEATGISPVSGAPVSTTVIGGGCPTVVLSPSTLPNGAEGAFYSETITASGGTGTYFFTVVDTGAPVIGEMPVASIV